MYSVGKTQVTIAMIAAELGLSISIVSKALRKRPKVTAAIRKRVFKHADKMGYVLRAKPHNAKPAAQAGIPTKPPTIYDIASRVGLSTATVSRALNHSPKLKPKTAEKVMAAARDMGFVINNSAANLVAQHHHREKESSTTIYTLAKALNLSAATISRAFSKNARISPQTRQRVLQKAAELNFTPNADAVKLKSQVSFTLGLLVPKISHPATIEITTAMEAYFAGKGMGIVMATYDSTREASVRIALDMLERISNGNVYMPLITGKKTIDWRLKKPLVILDASLLSAKALNIPADQYTAAYHKLGQRCAALFMDKMIHQVGFPSVPVQLGFEHLIGEFQHL